MRATPHGWTVAPDYTRRKGQSSVGRLTSDSELSAHGTASSSKACNKCNKHYE